MPTLKTLLDQKQEIENQLVLAYGEISEEQEKALTEVNLSLPEKVDKYIGLIDRLEHDAEYFKNKAEKYSTAAKQITRLKEKLLSNVRENMITNGLTELRGNDELFKLAKNKGSLVIESETAIPRMYYHQEVIQKLDRAKLKTDVQSGTILPGVRIEPTLTRSINKGIK